MPSAFNPFDQKPPRFAATVLNWKQIYPKSYDKTETDPFTKTRVILMNGTEYEAVWFSHQFHRHCTNNDIRRVIARARREEQQQQKQIACLKPLDESILETTIGYEQLAVDLTAAMAQTEPCECFVKALNFALLEDFDHLYRYADLLEMEHGIRAEQLVGHYTEIMPGRPTISEHRYAFDDVKPWLCFKKAEPLTKLHAMIITAAEQQTMNYYMNQCQFYTSDPGRRLYQEIAMIEEQHVTQYGSFIDPDCTWLESNLMHEYVECYLYYSCLQDETHPGIKKVWEAHLEQEIGHLHDAAALLEKYEGKCWQQVIPDGNFPPLIKFQPNKDYIRKVLKETVTLTADREDYREVSKMPREADFFAWQDLVNKDVEAVPSHAVIASYQAQSPSGEDYRYTDSPSPVKALQDRKTDNTTLGRA